METRDRPGPSPWREARDSVRSRPRTRQRAGLLLTAWSTPFPRHRHSSSRVRKKIWLRLIPEARTPGTGPPHAMPDGATPEGVPLVAVRALGQHPQLPLAHPRRWPLALLLLPPQVEQALGALGQALEVLAQALGVSGPPQALLPLGPHPQHLQILHLRSERPQRRRHSPLGVLEQALGALEQVLGALEEVRGRCLALAALGLLPPALLRLLASAPQQQVLLHLAP